MKFGEKVRLLRNEKKLSQTELGKMCGLSLRTIRNYEVDGRYPKQREVYAKLATALGCEINFLFPKTKNLFFRHNRATATKVQKMPKNWLPVCLRSLPAGNCPRMIKMP